MTDNQLRSEFTDALRDVTLDLKRDGVVYIDPKSQSNLEIATKIKLALEINDLSVEVRKTRYPQDRDYSLILSEC